MICLPNWLGDMVMATPFLLSLRSLPCTLWGLGGRTPPHLYEGLDIFDGFLTFEGRRFFDLVFLLRRQGFERGIILSHSLRPALLFFLAGVRERIGYDVGGMGPLLTYREKRRQESTVDHYLRLLKPLGVEVKIRAPLLRVTGEEVGRFQAKHPDVPPRFSAFIVGARFGPSKMWPEEHFSRLAEGIARDLHIPVFILPGPGEKEIAYRIRDLCREKDRVFIKVLDVAELKVMLSRAVFVVTNDTGPRHIAAALSVPTFVLLGPMDESYTSYPSPTTYLLKADVACRPCNRKTCNRDHACMRAIRPAQVLERIEEVMRATL